MGSKELFSEKELTREFPITKRFLYFSSAGTGIMPQRSISAQISFLDRYRGLRIFHDRETFAMLDELRENLAKLTGANDGEIALTTNTSNGICAIANSMDWREGDEIIVGNREFPANTYPWLKLKKRGVVVKWVEMKNGKITRKDIENNISEKTRLITISSVQFTDGFRADIASIHNLCEFHSIILFIDAIQSAGALSMNLGKYKLCCASAGGQKHLLSPYGTGFLYISHELQDKIEPACDGWLSHFIGDTEFKDLLIHDKPPAPDARKFEVGSLSYGNFWGMSESIKMLLEIGIDKIEKHNLALAKYFCDRILEIPSAQILSERNPKNESHIVSVSFSDIHALHDSLKREGIYASLREGALRFSFHIYNTHSQIDRAIEKIKKFSVK